MLDFEYAKALAEVVLDTTCSKKEREVRLECLTQIFGRANAYLKKGFLPDVVEAFFVRKMEGLPLVSTKQDMQDFLKVSTPHYFGGKFTVSNIPYLPIGLPPKHYAELCERYESYFKRQGKIHDINYCGSTYHITIGEVMAFPQDYAAMMTMIEKLQQIPKVVGIDIGGFTTDYLLMRKGNPDMEACDSMEKGVITMYNKIISGINSEYDILLEESDIDSILQGNTEFYEEAVVRMTESMVQDFVKDLLNSIRERGIDTKAAYTVFIGGGAKLLSHFLEQSDRLGKYTFIEDISANAKGYDRLFQIM